MRARPTLAALAGLGFAAAVLVEEFAIPGNADSSAPPAAIAGYYLRHGRTDLVADHISLLATPLLVVFLFGVAARLTGAASRFVHAAVTVAAVLELAATAIEMTLAADVASSAPPTTTAALFQVSSRFFFLSLVWLGLTIGTLAWASPHRPWVRGLGAVTGAVLTGAGLSVAHPHGALGVLLLPAEGLLVLWVVTVAVGLVRTGTPDVTEARAPVAA